MEIAASANFSDISQTLYFIPDNRAKWLVLSAWVTSIIFSVPILFFFDLAETQGDVRLFFYLNI